MFVENLGSVLKSAAIDEPIGLFAVGELQQPIDEQRRLEAALHIGRHNIGGGEVARVEIVEKIGDERPIARPPRGRGKRPSGRGGDED